MAALDWLFGATAEPGRSSARWGTAVHEAAHVVAAGALGGRATARLARDGTRGSYSGTLPDDDDAVAEAVVLLAGRAGALLLADGDGHDGHSDDNHRARRLLRGTGVSMEAASRRAAQLVRDHRGEIEAAAARGYRTGRI